MKIEHVEIENAKNMISGFDYALVYEISKMYLVPVAELTDIDWDEVQEGFFFNGKAQLHIYKDGELLIARCASDEESDICIDREYPLAGKFKGIGKNVIERQYLVADDDGQMCVSYTRLVAIQ